MNAGLKAVQRAAPSSHRRPSLLGRTKFQGVVQETQHVALVEHRWIDGAPKSVCKAPKRTISAVVLCDAVRCDVKKKKSHLLNLTCPFLCAWQTIKIGLSHLLWRELALTQGGGRNASNGLRSAIILVTLKIVQSGCTVYGQIQSIKKKIKTFFSFKFFF